MQETMALRTVSPAERAAGPSAYLLRGECTVTLAIRPIWSVCGRAMTFAATVAAVPPGVGTPTGTVTFRADDRPATPAVLTDGVATFTIRLDAGPHTIIADYTGDARFHPVPRTTLTTRVWRTGFPGPDEDVA